MEITIRGSIYSIKVDNEGFSRIVLDIPSSDIGEVVKLIALTQEPLQIKFALDK